MQCGRSIFVNSLPATPDDGDDTPSESEIVQEIIPMLRPDMKERGVEIITTFVRKHHSGPLPAPDDFEHYDRVVPGAAERILAMAETQQAHRHKQEGRAILLAYAVRLTGQFGAMVALLALLGTVAFCAYMKQEISAAIIGAVGTIVIGFLRYSSQTAGKPAADKPSPAKKKPPASKKRR